MKTKRLRALNLGRESENLVGEFLMSSGWKIIERNYRTRGGEIDLIAMDGQELVFVEVRARKSGIFSSGLESLTATKRRRIRRAANIYCANCRGLDEYAGIRFDLVTVEDGNIEMHVRGW